MGMEHAEVTLQINATTELCFQAIIDYESFPAWQKAVKRVDVLERNGDGVGEVVEFVVDAKVRELRYRLRYRYEAPTRLWCEFLEGDVAAIESEYTFVPSADGGTMATYRVGLDTGLPVPGVVMRRIAKALIRDAARDLKREAERRVAARTS